MNKTALNSQKEKHSMLSLRRATFVGLAAHRLRNISIHALLAESDADNGDAGNGCDAISIHALLAESDSPPTVKIAGQPIFLSTLSLRRATNCVLKLIRLGINFYPRSPCGERPISHPTFHRGCNFYPRSPCGERRKHVFQNQLRYRISIHALLAESDHSRAGRPCRATHFYPRSPCGERLPGANSTATPSEFLSTLSLRRATGLGLVTAGLYHISIHALLAESDRLAAP